MHYAGAAISGRHPASAGPGRPRAARAGARPGRTQDTACGSGGTIGQAEPIVGNSSHLAASVSQRCAEQAEGATGVRMDGFG